MAWKGRGGSNSLRLWMLSATAGGGHLLSQRGPKSRRFFFLNCPSFFLGAVEKTRDVHGTIVFGEWWWCVFVYMMYMIYMGWFWMLAISSGRCGSVIVTAWNIPRSSLGNA